MHVIRHQDVGMNRDVMAACRFLQLGEIAGVVRGLEEARLAIVAALDDVLGNAGEIRARVTRHDGRSAIGGSTIRLAHCGEDQRSHELLLGK
jgi:hypothetical protein